MVQKLFLSTPSARRATRCSTDSCVPCAISIHALREEGDILSFSGTGSLSYFYPRPPRGGRHLFLLAEFEVLDFYPRPPRGGRLERDGAVYDILHYFYPRPPRGGRPFLLASRRRPLAFLSTPSARRATAALAFLASLCKDFYPRPPRGGRRGGAANIDFAVRISIHALREEGDPDGQCIYLSDDISIHALREEGDAGWFR